MQNEKKQIRSCKKCSNKRFSNLTICYSHYQERSREKRLEKLQRKSERKARLKEKKANSPKVLKKKLDTILSLYVRLKASDTMGMASCITCGVRKHYKELQAGHYVPRDNYSVRYDLRNLAVQCFKCNMKLPGCKAGNMVQYTKYLLINYGVEWLKELIQDGEKIKQWTPDELKELISKYQLLLKTL